MKIREIKTKKFQEGGAMVQEAPMPQDPANQAPQGQQEDPMTVLLQGAMEAVQSGNCDVAMGVCQALVQLAQQGQGAPQGEPVYAKKGGTLKVVKRA